MSIVDICNINKAHKRVKEFCPNLNERERIDFIKNNLLNLKKLMWNITHLFTDYIKQSNINDVLEDEEELELKSFKQLL